MIDIDPVLSEIRDLRVPLEEALADGLREHIREHGAEWSTYERESALKEMYGLSEGKDCTYDRPSIGVGYAVWYHPSRVEDMIRLLVRPVAESRDGVDIVDIGCGTGATVWALATIVQAIHNAGNDPKAIRISGGDSSPFMIETARTLWASLTSHPSFAAAADLIDVECSTEHTPPRRGLSFPWLTAGYVIDHSDITQPEEVAKAIAKVARDHHASRMYLTTSERKSSNVLPGADASLRQEGWRTSLADECEALWPGVAASSLVAPRSDLYGETALAEAVSRTPVWHSQWTTFRSYTRSADESGQRGTLGADYDDGPLDPVQCKARDGFPADRPEVIVGAAGSGKSIVLAHRISKTIIDAFDSMRSERILVTCFNKGMVRTLVEMWGDSMPARFDVERLDDPENSDDSDQTFAISDGERTSTCRFINIDKIPTRMLGYNFSHAPGPGGEIPGAVLVKRELSVEDQSKLGKYLEPDFLLDEIFNVVAGQGAVDWETYSDVQRRGRPFRSLARGGPERAIIWEAITRRPTDAFSFRWWAIIQDNLTKIEDEVPLLEEPFDHVFVDEAQDFTEYQLRFAAGLAVVPSRFVVAVDQAQSIRIGPSFDRPTFRTTTWAKKHELEGSYRLPVRVAEAARPLADSISRRHSSSGRTPDTVSPVSRKAAVLGFRPIVIDADRPEDLDEVIRTYLHRVPLNGAKVLTVAQGHGGLNGLAPRLKELVADDWDIRGEWVEAIKGQERPVVIWRSAALRGDPIGKAETVYTIATRTTSLLVIQLDTETPAATQAIIGRLDPDRLLFWSPGARRRFGQFARVTGTEQDPLIDSAFDPIEGFETDELHILFTPGEPASDQVPAGEAHATAVEAQQVWQSDGKIYVSDGGVPEGFTTAVFDEAFTVWMESGMSMNPEELGRVSDPRRLRTLLRLFSAGVDQDVAASTETVIV